MEPTPAPPDGSGTATGGDEQSNPVSVVAVLCGSVHCATESWDDIRFGNGTADDGLDTSLLSSSYSSSVASSPGGGQSKSLATTLSIVLSIVGAVVLTALFTLYYHHRRRRRRRQRQQRPVLELLDDDNAPYLPLDSAGTTPPSTGPPSDGPPDRTQDVASHRTDSARPGQPDPDMPPPPPLHRRTAGPRPPEMAQLPAPAPGSPHSLVVASMLARDAPPPLPRRPRPRATTLGDAPHDDLPPYVDPIEEALAGDTPPSPDSDGAALQPDIQSPPPYDTIATPDRAEVRH